MGASEKTKQFSTNSYWNSYFYVSYQTYSRSLVAQFMDLNKNEKNVYFKTEFS